MPRIESSNTGFGQFNMTPIIDVVFLLIIFFMLVCQFIVAENFEVAVPDDISSAQADLQTDEKTTTVTVMFDENGGSVYAVGSEKITAAEGRDITSAIASEINKQLQNLPLQQRMVSLRIDKDIPYRNSQYAIAGISRSTASDIKLAVTKDSRDN